MEQVLVIVRELRFFAMVVTAYMSKSCPDIIATKVYTVNDEICVRTKTYRNLNDFDVAHSRLVERFDFNLPKIT